MTQDGKRRALGRGLEALFGDHPDADLLTQARPVPISHIQPNRLQPRTRFKPEELKALTESVRLEGVLVPVLLRPSSDGYELIAGERRWRAAQAAGLREIPAIIRQVDDQHALELAIIENEQRDDLSAIESARAYRRLVQEFSLTQQQVAERIGVSRAQVTNLIRLLQLPDSIQVLIEDGQLDMGHSRPLVGLPEADAVQLAKRCVSRNWSARQMEREAKRASKGSRPRETSKKSVDIIALEESLSRSLGLTVEFRLKTRGSGMLGIYFKRPEELDSVIARLR